MNIKAFAALCACKLSHKLIRLLRRGGTAMPGKIALKICPELLSHLSKGVKTVVVTGTNGKTTTARMLEQAMKNAGVSYIANRSGANLLSGILTEFALSCSLSGRCRAQYAVIECDEAASRQVLWQLDPAVILVTNLFNDQLDRFGSVTHTLELLREGISKVPNALLCLNADDGLSASLGRDLPNESVYYGMDCCSGIDSAVPDSDESRCVYCGTAYEYERISYGHLGIFRCPQCGYARPEPSVCVKELISMTPDESLVKMDISGVEHDVNINLPAVYNIYNASGAIAAACKMGISAENAVGAVGSFSCGFGRMERFDIGAKGARMILVKNTAGFNQVLELLKMQTSPFSLVICQNNREADGTDISWIEEVSFECLSDMDKLVSVTFSGMCCDEMYARFERAGISPDKLRKQPDYSLLTGEIAAMEESVFVVPSYTAMLEFREHLIRHCGGKNFWE